MIRRRHFSWVCLLSAWATTSALADASALVQLATARRDIVTPEIKAFGTVAADTNHLTTVAAPRECQIVQIAVRPGQTVNINDPVAVIATAPAATTQYQQAASSLAFAEKDLTHTRELFNEQLATRSQLAAAEKAYSDARAQAAEQTHIGANHPTETLRSPSAGVVATINGAPGDRVQQGAALASIATRSQLVVNVGLEPEDAPTLSIGARARLVSPHNGALQFAGQIVSISAMMDPQSRLVNVVIALPQDRARRLILGTVLEARIAGAPTTGVVIPKDALMTDIQGTYVYVVRNGVAHRRAVALALESNGRALIARGVAAGDRVVVTGNAGVADNMAVRTH